MARITLKVTKPPAPAAAPKAPPSRAKRAQLQNQRHKPLAPAPVAPVPPPSVAPRVAPVAGDPLRTVPRTESDRAPDAPAAKLSRRGKPLPAEGSRRRATAGSPGTPRGDDRGKPGAGAGPKRAFNARKKSSEGAPTENRPRAPAEYRPRTDRGKPRSAYAAGAAATPRAVRTPDPNRPPRHENPDDPRLSKRMSEMGLCSRREADEWIENGWVKVDGKVVDVLGVRVSPFARIEVAKAAAQHQSEQVTILLNKPIGYVSGQAEDGHTPAAVLIKPENRWADDPADTKFKLGHLRGLAPAGRLDIDSTGLIVFTQDGRIAKRLIGSHSEVEKEYLVRVEGKLDDAGMKLLQHGLELDGVKLKPARVSWQNEDQLRFVLREGRKRQIRRMCELVGLAVTGLKRVRTGSVSLGPLPVGQWRYLRPDEKF
ncbi:MAG: pseudouridine synthase [Casimicrobiaceae bacterium]